MTNNIARTATLLSFTVSRHTPSELAETVRNLEKTINTYGVIYLFLVGGGGLPPLFSDILFGGKFCADIAAGNALHRRALSRLVAAGKARIIRYHTGVYAAVAADYKVQEHRNWIDTPTDQAAHYVEVNGGVLEAIRAHEDAGLEGWAREQGAAVTA